MDEYFFRPQRARKAHIYRKAIAFYEYAGFVRPSQQSPSMADASDDEVLLVRLLRPLDEYEYAEAAIKEEEETGSTDKRCKRCGTRYLFHPGRNSYSITCETARCFQLTARGV